MTKNLTGQTFGFLYVLSFSHSDGKVRYWLCRCICNKEFLVITSNLTRGTTKSCGCMRAYLVSCKTGLDPTELAFRMIYNDYKSRAKQKKFGFDLSFEQFKLLLTSNCHYCGVPPSLKKVATNKLGTATIFYNGIDRKDNKSGYLLDNSVTCCKLCNYAKKAMSYLDFLFWLDRIANFNRQNN